MSAFADIPKYSFEYFAREQNNEERRRSEQMGDEEAKEEVVGATGEEREKEEEDTKYTVESKPLIGKRREEEREEEREEREKSGGEEKENAPKEKPTKSRKRIKFAYSCKEMNFPIVDWDEFQKKDDNDGSDVVDAKTSTLTPIVPNESKIEIPSWRVLPPDSSDEDTSDEAFTVRHYHPEVEERKVVNRARGFRLRKKAENDLLHLQKFLTKSSTFKNCITDGNGVNQFAIENVISEYIESIFCCSCNQGDREEELLLCDSCNKAIHTYCNQPPLKSIPPGRFYCKNCKKTPKRTKRKKKLPKQTPKPPKKTFHYNLRTKVK